MITVKELQEARVTCFNNAMKKIEQSIIHADNTGNRAVNVHVTDLNWPIPNIIDELVLHGFNAKECKYSSIRDEYHYIEITWS